MTAMPEYVPAHTDYNNQITNNNQYGQSIAKTHVSILYFPILSTDDIVHISTYSKHYFFLQKYLLTKYYHTRSSGPYGAFLLAPAEGIGGPFGPSLGAFHKIA